MWAGTQKLSSIAALGIALLCGIVVGLLIRLPGTKTLSTDSLFNDLRAVPLYGEGLMVFTKGPQFATVDFPQDPKINSMSIDDWFTAVEAWFRGRTQVVRRADNSDDYTQMMSLAYRIGGTGGVASFVATTRPDQTTKSLITIAETVKD